MAAEDTMRQAVATLRARTGKELEDMRLDLCALEAVLDRERCMLRSIEQAIEWDRICCQLGVCGDAGLQDREELLRNQRKQWAARDTAAQHVRVCLEEEQAWRAMLLIRNGVCAALAIRQREEHAVADEDIARLIGSAICDFFVRCRHTELEIDEKAAAPAFRFTPRRTGAEEPPTSFVLTATIASDGHVQAADEQGAYRHFNLLQDHPSEWFVR